MAADEITRPVDDADAPDAVASDEADTEGHSVGLLLGLNALGTAREGSSRARARKDADESLPPLSKKWPRLRDDKTT